MCLVQLNGLDYGVFGLETYIIPKSCFWKSTILYHIGDKTSFSKKKKGRTQWKNSSNGQDKLIQKIQWLFGLSGKPKYGNPVLDLTKEQLDMRQS